MSLFLFSIIRSAFMANSSGLTITGDFDLQTKEALQQFQTDNRLEVGGLSPETLNRLGIRREPLISVDFD